MKKNTLGIIIGNRDFFPDYLIADARKDILQLLNKNKIESIILSDQDTKNGGVETFQDAQKVHFKGQPLEVYSSADLTSFNN